MRGEEDLRLTPTVRAPAEARGAVERLAPDLRPEECEAIQLLVSELVTNSVRHAGLERRQWIDLEIETRPESVRVTVSDPGPGFQVPSRTPRPDEPGGWGLFLVERMADRWGITSQGTTRVWFELSRPVRAPSGWQTPGQA
jgi:anti-sigma regulatory factor (Ser/Thr protein kinase)